MGPQGSFGARIDFRMVHSLTTTPGMHTDTTAEPLSRNGAAAAQRLAERLRGGEARIGVVGLGYVGLPLAVEYADRGFTTVGVDVDADRVARLNAGENWNEDLADETVRRVVTEETLTAETDVGQAGAVDVFFVCVPTPLTAHKDPASSRHSSVVHVHALHPPPRPLP